MAVGILIIWLRRWQLRDVLGVGDGSLDGGGEVAEAAVAGPLGLEWAHLVLGLA